MLIALTAPLNVDLICSKHSNMLSSATPRAKLSLEAYTQAAYTHHPHP